MASYGRPGRLLPRRERGLRAGSVMLHPGYAMDWHSTKRREELLIILIGRVHLEVQAPPPRHGPQRFASQSEASGAHGGARALEGAGCRPIRGGVAGAASAARGAPRTARRRLLRAGQCALLAKDTLHRVVNRSRATARYLYVTAPADGASAR